MKIYQVGGSVRDEIMGRTPHDIDYCVVGSTIDEMLSLGYQQVGKDFPVFLHPTTKQEYALARTERKTGDKHTDFTFDFNKDITLEDDLVRRDFTCNAIAKDGDNYIDPFKGIDDIKNRVLKMVRKESFMEDPLRVLRFARFAAQLDFRLDIPTLLTCKEMVQNGMLDHLTPERIWGEFEKALNTDHFDVFINTLKYTDALRVVLPEVDKLFITPENPEHHPELFSGDHTILTIEEGIKMGLNKQCIFALLLHDIGKIDTPIDILPKHIGHEERGIDIIENICTRLRVPNEYKDFAKICCKYHMKVKRVPEMKIGHVYDIVEELTKFKNFDKLYKVFMVSLADSMGRKKEISEKNKTFINDGLQLCTKIYNVLKDVGADKFEGLERYKGKEFGEILRVKKIQYFLDNS